jgi:hypothetical protein
MVSGDRFSINEWRLTNVLVALGLLSGAAWAERPEPTPELIAERDQLIDKITRGVDYEASVKRFAALVQKRDAVIATSAAAQAKERAEKDAQRSEADARRKLRDEYHKTGDYEVSWRCTLSPDPAHPRPSKEGRFKPDWGRVVRKQAIRLAPKNALYEGELATMYEVDGVARKYVFRGDRFDPWRKPFEAKVGDLVLVCDGGEDLAKGLPPDWGERWLTSGFAVKINEPPLITKKTRWNPIHITSSRFYWAIKDVKWPYEGFVLANLEPDKDLGGGRFEIKSYRDMSWILEVPAKLKHHELVKPGEAVWVIMGPARFDSSIKKMVLTAEDLEAHYVLER